MGIVLIEERTFEEIITKVNSLAGKIEKLSENSKDKSLQEWLDNQAVCEILNISKRTLQTYREKGLLPFCQVKYKVWYKSEDVEKLLESFYQKPAK